MKSGPVVVRDYGVPFPNLPPAFHGFRIAHVTDLNFHRWNRVLQHARDLLRTLDYDLLAITGDFCVAPERWKPAAELLYKLLDGVKPPHGILGTLGNHDGPELAEQAGLPLTFLRDEVRAVSCGGTILPIAGIEQTMIDDHGLKRALAGVLPKRHAVLLAHYPSTVYRIPPGKVGLTLSGHTHGGQSCLPGLCRLWTNENISRKKGNGLHMVNNMALHVSAGLGVSGPILSRFFCPPEIVILTLSPHGNSPALPVRCFSGQEADGVEKFRKAV